MPKNIDDVILPERRRSIRNIPIPEGRRKSDKPSRVSVKKQAPPLDEEEYSPAPPQRLNIPRRQHSSRRRILLAGLAGALILVFAVLSIFNGATLAYTPRSSTLSFDNETHAARKTGETGLLYSIVKLSGDKGVEVTTSGEEEVSRKASGTIIVYNDASTEPQRLIENTRFEAPSGKIYRIAVAIVVPGKKTVGGVSQPGTIEATVLADLAVTHLTTPNVSVYPWNAGFGARYASPATLPTGTGLGVSFNKLGNEIAIGHVTGPFVSTYPWSSGFGAKYADPATNVAGTGFDVDFRIGNTDLAVAEEFTPFISVYAWNVGSGFGSKHLNPATLPAGQGLGVEFSPSGADIAVAHSFTPFITAYPWTTTFGIKYSDPLTLPIDEGERVAFSPDGSLLALASFSTPFILVYDWASGFGAKYADPATLPSDIANSVVFSPDGLNIAVAHYVSPFISVYPWSSGFGAKYADPATLPASTSFDSGFSPDGKDIAISHAITPFISVYPWASGFGVKYANPSTLPADDAVDVAWGLVSFSGSPYLYYAQQRVMSA